MTIVEKILRRLGYVKPQRRASAARSYSAAILSRLYNNWTTTNQSADAELRTNLKSLRARSREVIRNNDYARKFIGMVHRNVVGKEGIQFQSMVMNSAGKPNERDRRKIEEAWARWCRRGICEVTGRHTFRDVQKLVIGSVAGDGEILVRKLSGADNPFRFSLQLLEADHLDEMYNDTLANGNRVRMGVEYNPYFRPVAYHLFDYHPGDTAFGHTYGERIRVPAEEIIHVFHALRPSQGRGIPWMHAAMVRLYQLGQYEEAELVAARIGAAKMGFYTRNSDGLTEPYEGDDEEDDGTPIQEVEPGIFESLPKGWQLQTFDPNHPNQSYMDFVKAMLRGISSGIDVSYNYLANDLEGVNYSSIRAGVLDERDAWRDIQKLLIEHFLEPVYAEWLKMALLTRQVDLPFDLYERYLSASWHPRGWQWVDPEKEVNANLLAVQNGFKTMTQVAAEQGQDLETIFQQLQREREMAAKYGLKLAALGDLNEQSQG